MRGRVWILVACLAGSGLWSHAAGAQGKKADAAKSADAKDKDKDKEKEKARGYIKTGNKAANAGRWDDAYADYAIAWSIAPDWETAYPIGRAAYKTGHFAEAFARLTFHLKNAPPDQVPAKQRADVESMLTDAKSKTGALNITALDGDEVLLDNEAIGRAPLGTAIQVDPGKHKVEIRRGSQGETKTVEVTAGASLDVKFEAPKAATTTIVTVAPTSTAPPGNPLRTAGLITGGALFAGGLAIGGVFIGLGEVERTKRLKAEKDGDKKAENAAADAKYIYQNTALWGFVGAGVAAAGTVVFYFITRPSNKAPVKGAIGVTPAGPTVVIEGQF